MENPQIVIPGTAKPKGLVLMGGRSRRMGTDKAWMEIGGIPLYERAFSLLARVCSDVRLSLREDQLSRLAGDHRAAAIPDAMECAGPITGLLSAWELEPYAAWLVLACDYAAVTRDTVTLLLRGRNPGAPATAFGLPGSRYPEPLCTLYEPAGRPALQARFAQRRGSLSKFLEESGARVFPAPRPLEFRSLNTPGAMERFLRDTRSQNQPPKGPGSGR